MYREQYGENILMLGHKGLSREFPQQHKETNSSQRYFNDGRVTTTADCKYPHLWLIGLIFNF